MSLTLVDVFFCVSEASKRSAGADADHRTKNRNHYTVVQLYRLDCRKKHEANEKNGNDISTQNFISLFTSCHLP